jgi:hypothetical protein
LVLPSSSSSSGAACLASKNPTRELNTSEDPRVCNDQTLKKLDKKIFREGNTINPPKI